MLSKRKAANRNVKAGGMISNGRLDCVSCPFYGKCTVNVSYTCVQFCSQWLKDHPKKEKNGYHSDQHTTCTICKEDRKQEELAGGLVCIYCIKKKLDDLAETIERMRCCGNCKHYLKTLKDGYDKMLFEENCKAPGGPVIGPCPAWEEKKTND